MSDAPGRLDLSATLPALFLRLAVTARNTALPFWHRLNGQGAAGFSVDNKAGPGGFDPVTAADRAAEEAMRALLAAARPHDAIDGEEFPPKTGTSDLTWVLDPIDGTRAFICGFPTWTTLIALSAEDHVRAGLIAQPVLGEIFFGAGGGAWRLGFDGGAAHPLRVRKTETLTEAVLCATAPDMFTTQTEQAAFQACAGAARLTRFGADAYAYAMLAAGRVDLVIEAGLKPYDVQPLIPVVEGAGGVITDWLGGCPMAGGQVVAAATPALHAESLRVLSDAAT